jgi:hypothetical protein
MLMLDVHELVIVAATVNDTTVDELDVAAKPRSGSATRSVKAYKANAAEIPTVQTRVRR